MSPDGYDGAMAEQHRVLLAKSGVSPQVAKERGYFTAYEKVRLERCGFGRSQRSVPALVIPLWSVTGEPAGYQARPDAPRTGSNGRDVKYETPSKQPMVLDVHPSVRPMLGNPKVPLIVTEGVRKGDVAVSRDLCAVALLGVWNWRGTNEKGGTTALPDWENIALNDDRVVLIAFDSDVMLKEPVRQALERLGAFLASRKAKVRYVYLPAGPNGQKVGLDDWLADDEGRGFDELLALAEPKPRRSTVGGGPVQPPVPEHWSAWSRWTRCVRR